MSLNPSDIDITRTLAEYYDENKVFLVCSRHGALKGMGVPRCGECSHLFFRSLVAKMPPHRRAEGIARLEELTHKLIECESELAKVQFLKAPELQIEKGKN
jgi:hypothetical protein